MRLNTRIKAKRILDTLLVVLAAPIVLPVAIGTALAVRSKLGSPVVFKQQRIGLNEREFTLYKFRSMLPEEDEYGKMREAADRHTPFGRALRKSSLDEIPQLWNVLRGDMALVGPRPLLPEYLPYYFERERLRHSVRPGITGAAQVAGRNALSWDARLDLDTNYAESLSLKGDAAILLRTVANVVRRSDVAVDPSQGGELLSVYRSYPADDGKALRRFEPSDIPLRIEWFSDPAAGRTMRVPKDISVTSTQVWLANARKDPLRKDLVLYEIETGDVLALTGYKAHTEDSLPEMYIIVGTGKRGHGFGEVAWRLTLEMIRSEGWPGAMAEVLETNTPMMRIVERLGFVEVGGASEPDRIRVEARW